jgi:hypothetical protein
VSPLDLGRADQLEVAVGAGQIRADGPVRLVALVEGARRSVRVDLGRLEAGACARCGAGSTRPGGRGGCSGSGSSASPA